MDNCYWKFKQFLYAEDEGISRWWKQNKETDLSVMYLADWTVTSVKKTKNNQGGRESTQGQMYVHIEQVSVYIDGVGTSTLGEPKIGSKI